MAKTLADLLRNVKKVVRRSVLGKCWEWQRCKQPGSKGYAITSGVLSKKFGTPYVHRIVYLIRYEKVLPREVKVCHYCDNTLCIRPTHLFEASQEENVKDAVRKGRMLRKYFLADADIVAIRKAHATARFGLGVTQICKQYAIPEAVYYKVVEGVVKNYKNYTCRQRSR